MFRSRKGMKIGILTAGGDCPGINAAIRGVGKTAIVEHGMKVYGISSGFQGLITKDYIELEEPQLSGLLTLGGTILGTSREKPFKKKGGIYSQIDKPQLIKKNYKEMGLDALVCIGGNGTQRTAALLAEEGLNVIGIPKTIDNDVWGTDVSFGFDSAVLIATEAIDRLHTTANSHKRIMIIETMGHHAGWLALYSGIAGGGDLIIIPEIKYDERVICDYLKKRVENKKNYSIVVVAEGVDVPSKWDSPAKYMADLIYKNVGLDTRETILGYVQRGGSPSPADRLLATRYGASVVEMIVKEQFGKMVSLKGNEISSVSLEEVSDKLKTIPVDLPLLNMARNLDICFGNK